MRCNLLFFPLLFSLIWISGAQAQIVEHRALNYNSENLWIVKEIQHDIEAAIDAESVVFCGVDFSHLTFWTNDTSRNQFDSRSAAQFWGKQFEELLVRKACKRISSALKKDVTRADFRLDSTWKAFDYTLSSGEYAPLAEADILPFLKGLPETTSVGIGLLIVPECFQANTRICMVNYAFFDLQSRKLIWLFQLQTPVAKWETLDAWSQGLNSTFFRFRKLYADRTHSLKKIKRKYGLETVR